MRDLVTGRETRRDTIISELVTEGYISKAQDGKRLRYQLTDAGNAWLTDDDDEG